MLTVLFFDFILLCILFVLLLCPVLLWLPPAQVMSMSVISRFKPPAPPLGERNPTAGTTRAFACRASVRPRICSVVPLCDSDLLEVRSIYIYIYIYRPALHSSPL